MKRAIVVLLYFATAVTPSIAGDLVYHGSFLWNNIRDLAPQGNYMYCAFHDGLGCINMNLDFNKKKLYSSLEIPGRPRRVDLFDTLAVVENELGEFVLVSIADPLNMRRLGSFTPDRAILDVAVLGNFLYMAVGFDGLYRYDISNPADINFDDSSMTGIHVTHLETYQSRLFVLDDYNGILIYEPGNDSLAPPVTRLLLPYQALTFVIHGDTVYAPTRPTGYMTALIADVYQPLYLAHYPSLTRGDYVSVIDQGLVLANSLLGFELIYPDGDSAIDQLFPIEGIRGRAVTLDYRGSPHVLYPHAERGLIGYDITDPELIIPEFPQVVYATPGPITQVAFIKSRLHVIGTNNWYEIFDLSDPAHPTQSGRIINPPYQPAGVGQKGDTLFIADIKTNTIFPAIDAGTGDPHVVGPFITTTDLLTRPVIIPDYFGGGDLLYYANDNIINGTLRDDTITIPNLFRWQFPNGISSALISDTVLYHASSKGDLRTYVINQFLQPELASVMNPPGRVTTILKHDTLLYLSGPELLVASIANPIAPQLTYSTAGTGDLYELVQDGDWLLAAGKQGVSIFDISAGIPLPLYRDGDEAKYLAYFDHTIAASDGHSVKIYTLPPAAVDDLPGVPGVYSIPRLYGYPNPFNPTIKLMLENLPPRSEGIAIDVYDILGRKVKSVAITPSNGLGEVFWDGRDERGQPVASGIYLFRTQIGSEILTYKAALIK